MAPETWDAPLPGFEPSPEKPRRPMTRKEEDDAVNKIQYRRFSSAKRVHCQDCIDNMLGLGVQTFCHQAAYTRIHQGVERLLCYQHAQEWRDKDGLDALRN